jgi:hypothetical protein
MELSGLGWSARGKAVLGEVTPRFSSRSYPDRHYNRSRLKIPLTQP